MYIKIIQFLILKKVEFEMKVAIFTDTFIPQTNGVVTSICNTIKELSKRNIDIIVFAPGKTTHMEYYDGAKVYFFKSKPLGFYKDYLLANINEVYSKIFTLLEMENPDVYHAQDPFVIGFMGMTFAQKFKKPLIGSYHTFYEEYAAHLSKGRYKGLMKYLFGKTSWPYIRIFFSSCGTTIAPGNEIAKILNRHGIKNVKVIPNAVDLNKVKNRKKFDVWQKHGIPKNAKIILYLGRISFEKKIEILLKAFKNLYEKNAYLLIVGSGPSLKSYQKMANSMKIQNVIFTDYIDDNYVTSYYNAADVFAMPSDTETFSIVTMEAFAAGKPVVGPDKLGTKDLIIDGYNGLKFRSGNYFDMASKLSTILNDRTLRERLGKNARKYSENYSIEKVTNELINVYKMTQPKNFKLREIIAFWPKLNISQINYIKNHKLVKYLKRIKSRFY